MKITEYQMCINTECENYKKPIYVPAETFHGRRFIVEIFCKNCGGSLGDLDQDTFKRLIENEDNRKV